MIKIALSVLLLSTVLSVTGCDDDEDEFVIIDTDGDGIPDNEEAPPPGVLQWNADLDDVDSDTSITGNAVVQQVEGALSFSATVVIRDDDAGVLRPWHVHFGTCASGGDIVGLDADYARLTVANDGAAISTARVGVPLDPLEPYHVNIHFSDAEFNRIIACGDLILQ